MRWNNYNVLRANYAVWWVRGNSSLLMVVRARDMGGMAVRIDTNVFRFEWDIPLGGMVVIGTNVFLFPDTPVKIVSSVFIKLCE